MISELDVVFGQNYPKTSGENRRNESPSKKMFAAFPPIF